MAIVFNNLTFTYFEEAKPVISELSGSFNKDKITVLTGVSGCGKSTLMFLAAGLYPHSAGKILGGSVNVEGENPDTISPQKRTALTAMMFQNPELQFCMDTPLHELEFVLENIATPPEEIPQKCEEALKFVGIEGLSDHTLLSLSGGERQKVMLACLYILKPQWLLLDEPFANIDNAAALEISKKLFELHTQFGTGILAVDHRLDSWLSVADEIRFMSKGKLLDKTMDAKNPDFNFLEEAGIIVPNRPYLSPRPPKRAEGKTALSIENLSVFRRKTEILSGVNAKFDCGRIHGIVGESGCGKSTLFGALSGIYKSKGKVTVFTKELKRSGKKERIGFVTQNPQDQFIGDTVKGEIAASMRDSDDETRDKRCEEILRKIKLYRYRDISPYMLSQGQQRRLGVAALIAYNCKILVCDEPTYAQDRIATIAIMDELVDLVEKENLCLIISTHDRRLAEDYCDTLWNLKGGRLVELT